MFCIAMQVVDAFIDYAESIPYNPDLPGNSDLVLGYCQVGIMVGAESLHGREARKRRLRDVFVSSDVQPHEVQILGGMVNVLVAAVCPL